MGGNPCCPNCLKEDGVHVSLKRQHSGRQRFWVCTRNKKHRYPVGSALIARGF